MKIRLFSEQELKENLTITLGKAQSHYLSKVLRCQLDDEIFLFDNLNGEFTGKISALGKNTEIIINQQSRAYQKPLPLTLAFAPVKNVKTEFLALKATELNISSLQPILTARTIVRKIKPERVKANIIEAAEQSESIFLPDLHELKQLGKFIDSLTENDILIFCDESRVGQRAKDLFPQIPKSSQYNFYLLIGPEGGFSPDEKTKISSFANCYNLSLGDKILRADTAIIAALAVFNDWFDN